MLTPGSFIEVKHCKYRVPIVFFNISYIIFDTSHKLRKAIGLYGVHVEMAIHSRIHIDKVIVDT